MAAKPSAQPASDGDRALQFFDRVFPDPSWQPWRAWLHAVFGIVPKADAARELIKECTGRPSLPTRPAREAWVIAGRRAGKSKVSSLLAVYAACFRQYQLSPGERGRVVVIAADKRQATVVHEYVAATIAGVPALAAMVTRQTAGVIDLSNNVTIEILTADFRSLRGRTVVAAVCDEVAFWEDSGPNTDAEVLTALRPSMATIDNGLIVALSTPYARRGALWQAFDKHWGKDSDASGTLIWRAPSLVMHPTLDERIIEAARADDAVVAASEYDAEFRSDLERLFSQAAVQAVTMPGRHELAPQPGQAYVAFADPSGGSADAFSLAIAHRDRNDHAILDCVREQRPPFDPSAVCEEFASILKTYRIVQVTGDHYAGVWPAEQFRKFGIKYATASQTRSEIYLETLPLLNSGRIELLDHPRLAAQLIGLDRRTGKSGRDCVDHRQGAHDDLSNASCGALILSVASTGLRAPWPSDFTRCEKSGFIPTFNLARCALLGGAEHPSGTACYERCPGWRELRPAWKAHQQTGGAMSLREFAREHYAASDFVSRVRFSRFMESGVFP